jgi:DNA-binding MarR family transcriptional regulator
MATHAPDDHLAFLIHLAAKRLRLEFANRAAGYGLTPSKARALAFLARRPGANLTALAEALEVQPMSVLRVVDDLEAQGMLRRDPDPKDRRALRLSLTTAGEAANAQVWRTLDGIVGEATQGMSAESLARLIDGLKSLVGGMERFGGGAPAEVAPADEARQERAR